MDEWMDGCRMDGWMDGWMDGGMDGWIHGYMDTYLHTCSAGKELHLSDIHHSYRHYPVLVISIVIHNDSNYCC